MEAQQKPKRSSPRKKAEATAPTPGEEGQQQPQTNQTGDNKSRRSSGKK
jgi:hypothetical protein